MTLEHRKELLRFSRRLAVVPVLIVGAFLELGASGCGYDTPSEAEFFARKEAERLARQQQRDAVIAQVPDAEVLGMVGESPAPDGSGSTSDWVARMVGNTDAQVLFPRWQVSRRGASKYEVRYTYTTIDETNHLSRAGLRWMVDAALKMVEGPDTMLLEDASRPERSLDQQQRRRVRDAAYSLE